MADKPQEPFVGFYPRDFVRFFGLFFFLTFVQWLIDDEVTESVGIQIWITSATFMLIAAIREPRKGTNDG